MSTESPSTPPNPESRKRLAQREGELRRKVAQLQAEVIGLRIIVKNRDAEVRAYAQATKDAEFDTGMADGIFAEIEQVLLAHPCQHDEAHGKPGTTPPMLFPEWIACVVARAQPEARTA